jgi:hypothetical protein
MRRRTMTEKDPVAVLNGVMQNLAQNDTRVRPNGLLNQIEHDFRIALDK